MNVFMDIASATVSSIDTDISRKNRVNQLQWQQQTIEQRQLERSWHDIEQLHRKEDMRYRVDELYHSDLEVLRREIDEKNEMLKYIAKVAALIGGFSLSVLIEMSVDVTIVEEWLLSIFCLVSSLTVCLMTFSYVSCTLILLAILKKFQVSELEEDESNWNMMDFNAHLAISVSRKQRFQQFWDIMCDRDFRRAYIAFSFGIPLFLVNTILATWVKFSKYLEGSIIVSIICGGMVIFLLVTSQTKWGVSVPTRISVEM
jgi:hypothetical protein